MGPENWKGERPAGKPGPDATRQEDERPEAGISASDDAREEEGWSQPESSAQKGPTPAREPED